MVKLKSYRLKLKKVKRRKTSSTKDIVTAGVVALIGTAFVAQTASVLNRL